MILDIEPGAKGLIFDIDGTLADTMPIHYESWREVCKAEGVEFTTEFFASVAGMASRKIIRTINAKLGCNLDVEKALLDKEEFVISKLHKVTPIEPVVSLVTKYHGKIPMSMGTGGRKDIAQQIVKTIGLDSYFDILVSADDVERYKPEPDTFLKCAHLMGVAPELCQVFEDSISGINAAKNAGMMITDVRPFYKAFI